MSSKHSVGHNEISRQRGAVFSQISCVGSAKGVSWFSTPRTRLHETNKRTEYLLCAWNKIYFRFVCVRNPAPAMPSWCCVRVLGWGHLSLSSVHPPWAQTAVKDSLPILRFFVPFVLNPPSHPSRRTRPHPNQTHLSVGFNRRVGEQNESGGVDEINHLNRVLPGGSVVAVPPQRLCQAVALGNVRERFQLPSELAGHKLHLCDFGLFFQCSHTHGQAHDG